MADNGKPKDDNVILDVKGLKKYFPITGGMMQRVVGYVKAVDDVNFFVREGETLGLVGESGCGKTTAGRAVLRLYEPTDGTIMFKSRALSQSGKPEWINVRELDRAQLKKVYQDISMIFQDPIGSLNPRMTVYDIITEPLLIHDKIAPDTEDYVIQLLERVGLRAENIRRYPHEFSGGQRQRIGIARALALDPSFIVCDEPISALDVSIQAQVVNLLQDLQEELNLTYLFIAHDLSMIRYICDRVAVMYLGKLVELGPTDEVYDNPQHPYTKLLLSAVPIPDPAVEKERKRMERPETLNAYIQQETVFKEISPGHFVASLAN
jgi:peptide/nickel transport system ATP-binding protein